jgi:hypothetical protein
MSTTALKLDYLFKEKLNRTTTSLSKNYFEEAATLRPVYQSQIYEQDIPSTPTGASISVDGSTDTTGVVQVYVDQALTWVTGTTSFYHNNLRNSVPFDYGDGTSYNYIIKRNDGSPLYFGESSWVVDNYAGVLNFLDGFPSGVSSTLTPTISFFKYIGTFGTAITGTITTGHQRWVSYRDMEVLGGSWSSVRTSSNVTLLRKEPAADTFYIIADVTDIVRTAASMGFRPSSISVVYCVSGASLTSLTGTLVSLLYADASTITKSTITTSNDLTATATAITTPYKKTVTITTPAFIAANTSISLELQGVSPSTSIMDLYAFIVNFDRREY